MSLSKFLPDLKGNAGLAGITLVQVVGFIADCLAIITTLATIYGIGDYLGGQNLSVIITLDDSPLAFRLMLLLLVCCGLGWALGTICKRLTEKSQEYLHIISFIMAGLFALILVAASEVIANQSKPGLLPQLQLFTIVGVGIVVMLCRFQYRSLDGLASGSTLELRSSGILIFVSVAFLIMLLLELS
jgi:hypothetical protein